MARTPAIDALSSEGVRCTDDITVAPITLPAHTSILTGLFPPAHGVRDNGVYSVPDRVETLAERLKKAGYRTQAFVSAVVLARRYHLDQGFDGYDDDLWAEDRPPLFMIRDRPAAKTAAKVLVWLDGWFQEPQRAPFFIWVHFFDPHQPYKPSFADRVLAPTLYDAEIAGVDRGVARIVDALKEKGVLDDTLVVLTADHGESLGEHEEKTHGIFIYDATLHVPLIFRYPRYFPSGRVYEGPVRAVDIVPTVLGILGLPENPPTQGKDLRWALRGWTWAPDLPQYSETLLSEVGYGMAPLYGIRHAGYKWIRAPRSELYDLRSDPNELTNLLPGASERGKQLDEELESILTDSRRIAVAPEHNPLDQETTEAMRALGYLTPDAERTSMKGMDPKDGIRVHNELEDARHHVQDGNWSDAESILRVILKETPANLTARNILGFTLLQQERLDEAEAAYKESLAMDPTQHRVLAMLGNVSLQRGDLDTAQRWFQEALDKSPRFVEAMANLGFIAAQQGNDAVARGWYEKGIAADPGFPHVYQLSADLYFERGEFADALTYYRKTVEALPTHFEAWIQAGNCAGHLGDLAGALAYNEHAAELRPDSPIPPYNSAGIYAVSGEPERAIAFLSQAVELGFQQPQRLEQNPDLVSLHERPDFQALLASLRTNAASPPKDPGATAGRRRRGRAQGHPPIPDR